MIARKCERCGAFYEPYSIWKGIDDDNDRNKKPGGIVFALTTEDGQKWTQSEWSELPHYGRKVRDLCPCCMDELLSWWFSTEKKADSPTAEDIELLRAYRREYMRRYRKEHPEIVKRASDRYKLRKALAAAAAGELPGYAPEQLEQAAADPATE